VNVFYLLSAFKLNFPLFFLSIPVFPHEMFPLPFPLHSKNTTPHKKALNFLPVNHHKTIFFLYFTSRRPKVIVSVTFLPISPFFLTFTDFHPVDAPNRAGDLNPPSYDQKTYFFNHFNQPYPCSQPFTVPPLKIPKI